jgi:hypothetical protein
LNDSNKVEAGFSMNTPNSDTHTIERRKNKRWILTAPAFFCWTSTDGDFRSGQGIALNLGTRGAYLQANQCPPVGTAVQVDFLLPDLRFEGISLHLAGEGVVVRTEPPQNRDLNPYSFGLSLRFWPEPDEARLAHYAEVAAKAE